jgi:type IV pilus assembly protein PilA
MKNNKKGFTLAELLIVVAIIAVLVAIAIPIFTSQLEKARESTDAANIRDMYAEISVALLNGGLEKSGDTITVTGGYTATLNGNTDGNFNVSVAGVKVNQTGYSDWKIGNPTVAGVTVSAVPAAAEVPVVFGFVVDTGASGNTRLNSVAFTTT